MTRRTVTVSFVISFPDDANLERDERTGFVLSDETLQEAITNETVSWWESLACAIDALTVTVNHPTQRKGGDDSNWFAEHAEGYGMPAPAPPTVGETSTA